MPTLLATRAELGLFLICVFLVVGVILHKLQCRGRHESRIAKYFRDRDDEPLEILWRPFGTTGLGKYAYFVRYRDSHGNEREANCLIDGWARVFVSHEPATHPSTSDAAEKESLAEENRRLRKEIADLKRLRK